MREALPHLEALAESKAVARAQPGGAGLRELRVAESDAADDLAMAAMALGSTTATASHALRRPMQRLRSRSAEKTAKSVILMIAAP